MKIPCRKKFMCTCKCAAWRQPDLPSAGILIKPSLFLQAEQAQRSYQAKVMTLKETAARKSQQDSKKWEARRHVVQQIYNSAQVLTLC